LPPTGVRRADDGFLDARKRRQNYEYGVRIYRDFSDAPGGDQSLSPKSLNLLSARIVAFYFELPFEQARGNCAAEKAETDDANAFHETSVVKKVLNHNFTLLSYAMARACPGLDPGVRAISSGTTLTSILSLQKEGEEAIKASPRRLT